LFFIFLDSARVKFPARPRLKWKAALLCYVLKHCN
jgi:hypothetical protein